MSDDLQEIEDLEESSELGTEEGKQNEPDAAQKAINKKHFQFKQAERERDAEREKREELERRLEAIERERNPTTIPDIPDPLDDDYEAKIRERDAAIARQVEREAQQKLIQNQQRLADERAQQEALEARQKIVVSYTERASELGVSPEDLATAGGQVEAYGVTQGFQDYLLTHSEGPLIVKYLATDLSELDKINSMSAQEQGVYVETQLKPKIEVLKPRTTGAPSPATNITGGGVDLDAEKYVYSKGATLE